MENRQTIKEAILVHMKDSDKVSFQVKDISEGLGMTSAADFKLIVSTLAEMERDGLVFLNKKGNFKLPKKDPLLSGIFRASDRGFGFVDIEGEDNDVYIAPNNTNFALDGDKVTIDIIKPPQPASDRGAEGKVRAVLERNFSRIVGEFFAYDDAGVEETELYGYVEPRDKKVTNFRVFVEAEGVRPVEGSIVQVEITHYPDKEFPLAMQGIVSNVIGHKNDPGIDILTIVHKHGIPTEFPEAALKQANEVPDKIAESDLKGRRDLREEVVVTIDGADAKDLDDAVAVRKLENGNYHLGVHIADVSYYVTENSPLDGEAFERGTSVYLTDRVIPMIPQRLSNGICSLNPHVDRLTMSCEMEITPQGEIVSHEVFQSVIRSSRRMTYTAVNQILTEKNEEVRKEYEDLVEMFELMEELHNLLSKKRTRRGSIDFDTREAKIEVDPEGRPTDVILRSRGVGERLIESFMLAANETVSEHYAKMQVPMIYRVHEQPDSERMQSFMEFVTAFGITMKGTNTNVTPKTLQQVLDQVEGKPEEAVVSTMMLRSMKQAKYDVEPLGHYGLAAQYYSHFTSPIRRYPDLILHRLIRWYEEHGTGEEQKNRWEGRLTDIADQSSKMERRAVDAERETDAMKKAEYMADKVGEEFDGVVGSVTKFGLFVELPNTIEGLVHISTMGADYFNFIENQLMLVGERTGLVYRIGQAIKVKVVRADPETREIDFEIIPDEDAPKVDNPQQYAKAQGRNDRRKGSKGNNSSDRGKKSGPRNDSTGSKNKGNKKKNSFYAEAGKKNKGRGKGKGRNK